MEKKYDIVIVGAGMVGATLACALAPAGLRIALVEARQPDKDWPLDRFDLRVSAVTQASVGIFKSLGVWDNMVARRVTPFREMSVWDAEGKGKIHFDSADIGTATLGYIVENHIIQNSLLEQLKQNANVEWLCPAVVSALERGSRATLGLEDGRVLAADLIVGADGGKSHIRQLAHIDVRGWDYDQQAIVAVISTQLPHRDTAWQVFHPTGPLALLPLTAEHCSIVWSADTPRAEQLMALSAGDFEQALMDAFGDRLGSIRLHSERAAFPLRRQHAHEYVQPHLALIGDAAHTIHPLAGQGVNLGLADAAVLAEVLLHARCAQRPLGSMTVLRRYERWRKGENLAMMTAMDGFKRLFGTRSSPLGGLRSLGLNLVNGSGPVKDLIARRAMGMSGDLPALARGVRPDAWQQQV